ncbi:hypothetical protein [Mycolicibacterium peregrinum]|nr:hypothetical protein [Mycolicibacterium peregrinum]CDO30929.1 hypothetical protein BN979_03739 [Mycolicibacterium vulneris]
MLISACILAAAGAPAAMADPYPALAQAVNAARGGSCGELKPDPKADKLADIVNQSTFTYVNHTAENVPADDPHPTAIAKDLGITGSKVTSLQGAGLAESDAIHGVLLEGFSAIPDCSYTEIGTSALREPDSGYTLVVVVLVGP